MDGVITNVTNLSGATFADLTLGPDKNIWATADDPSRGFEVVQITPSGISQRFPVTANVICAGPDGNLWFDDGANIDRMTTSGVITQVPIPFNGSVLSIAPSRDGGVWFTDQALNQAVIGRVDPHTLAIVTYDMSAYQPLLGNLVGGSDGNVWTSRQSDGDLIRITPSGGISTYPHGLPRKIRNDNPWLAERDGTLFLVFGLSKYLIRFSEAHTSVIDRVRMPDSNSQEPVRTSIGPDLNLWTSDVEGEQFVVYVRHVLIVTPISIVLNVGATQTATASELKTKATQLRAASSNPAIASVTNGPTAGTFVVTGIAIGSCTITIDDQRGNSVSVPITVD